MPTNSSLPLITAAALLACAATAHAQSESLVSLDVVPVGERGSAVRHSAQGVVISGEGYQARLHADCRLQDGPLLLTVMHLFGPRGYGERVRPPQRLRVRHPSEVRTYERDEIRLCASAPARDLAIVQLRERDDGEAPLRARALTLVDSNGTSALQTAGLRVLDGSFAGSGPAPCWLNAVDCGASLFGHNERIPALSFDLELYQKASSRSGTPLTIDNAIHAVVVTQTPVKVGGLVAVGASWEAFDDKSGNWLAPHLTEDGLTRAVREVARVGLSLVLERHSDRCPELSRLAREFEVVEARSLSWSREGLNERFGRARETEAALREDIDALRAMARGVSCPGVMNDAVRNAIEYYLYVLELERLGGAYSTLLSLEVNTPGYLTGPNAWTRLHFSERTPMATLRALAVCRHLRPRPALPYGDGRIGWTSFSFQPPGRSTTGFTVGPIGARVTCHLITHDDDGNLRTAANLEAGLAALTERPAVDTPVCALFHALQHAEVISQDRNCSGADRVAAEEVWNAYSAPLGEQTTWTQNRGQVAQMWSLASMLTVYHGDELIDFFRMFAVERQWSPELQATMRERFLLAGRANMPSPPSSADEELLAERAAVVRAHDAVIESLSLASGAPSDLGRTSAAARSLARYQGVRGMINAHPEREEALRASFSRHMHIPYVDPGTVTSRVEALELSISQMLERTATLVESRFAPVAAATSP